MLLALSTLGCVYAQDGSISSDAPIATHGVYNYSDSSYGYERQGLGDAVDFSMMSLNSLNGTIDRTIARANVGFLSNYANNWTLESSTGLGHTIGLGFCAFGEGVPRSLDPESIHLKAGPLMIDQIDVGGGLLYTDTTGHPPHQLADDGFGSIIWASARITIDFTEHISFTIRPIVYWLPFEGKVGYGLPPFIFGLPVLDPYSFTTLSYQAPIADWDVNIFDSFGAFYRYWTFWDRNQLRMNTWSDLSPIDLVGQYSLGGYGPQLDFALDGAPHSNISIFDKDRLYFENWSGFRALGKHGSNLQTMLYFDRRDRWDGQFNWDSAWMQGGAWVTQIRDHYAPYAGYNFWTTDNFNSSYQWAIAGSKFEFGPRAYGFAQAGILWSSGTYQDYTTWLGEIGATQLLGPYSRHGFQVGRRLSDPDGRSRYVENYGEYTIGQDIGPNSTVMALVGYADRTSLDRSLHDNQKVVLAGLHYNQIIPSTGTTLGLMIGYEHIQIDNNQSDFDRWMYRASVNQELRYRTTFTLAYQFTSAWGEGTKDDYTEHFLWMGLQKRF